MHFFYTTTRLDFTTCNSVHEALRTVYFTTQTVQKYRLV